MKYTFKSLAVAALVVALAGCAGYRVGNISGQEVQGIRTIYIPTAKNESYMPGLQTTVANAVARRISNDGTLATGGSDADAQLDITITDVRRNSVRSARTDVLITAQFEVQIEARITLTNKRLGKKVIDGESFFGRTQFYIQQDAIEGERQALPLAAEDLAYNIVKRITEGW
jgi:hypothetical protein